MFVLHAHGESSKVKAFTPPEDFASRFKRRLRRDRINREFEPYRLLRPAGFEPFQDSRSPHGADCVEQLPACDVVNLHWIADAFIDYPAFFARVPQRTPVVWTLHDMNAFTGGCHYDLGCGRFVDRCGACPQLGSTDAKDLSWRVWENKRAAFAQVKASQLRFVTPSRWLAQEAERSSLIRQFPLSLIPYGLDTEVFAPRNRGHARDVLGLPADAKVILFLADGLDNRRKGFPFLVEALAGLREVSGVMLLSVGRNHAGCKLKVPWLHLGSLGNDRMLSLVYSAADVFVISSLQDNLPNTVLESMACGTPVVGFSIGGVPDMVRPGIDGVLVEPENVEGLRAGLLELLQSPSRLAVLANECRKRILERHTLERQARDYVELYSTLLQARRGSTGERPILEMRVKEPTVPANGL